jgi:CheY-specific phosphatase CheX
MPVEPDLGAALWAALEEALDKMFFMDGVENTPHGQTPRPELSAAVAFEGGRRGVFTLRVTPSLARSIAADFLGDDPDALAEDRVREVVCELANMICGAALSQARGDMEFRLHEPRCPAGPDDPAAPPDAAIAVAASGGVLEAELRLDTQECPPTETSAS